jgi:hypothetical protein
MTLPAYAQTPTSAPEIVVERRGVGSAGWGWRLTRDDETFKVGPGGYRSAEEAYAVAQAGLGRGLRRV